MKKRQFLPGLLLVSLLFWGWTISLLPLGILFGLIFEASRWVPWRFQIAEKQLVRLFKLYFLIVISIFITLLFMLLNEGLNLFIQWLPILLAPILLVQLYHEKEGIPLQAIVESLVYRPSNSGSSIPRHLDFCIPYAIVSLIATSMAAPSTVGVFILFGVIITFSLYSIRPQNFRIAKWGVLCCIAVTLAFFIKTGLTELQKTMHELTSEWIANDWSQKNIFKSHTAMGHIGELKLSNKIIMRIQASEQRPLLLKQASYSHFISNNWHMRHSSFESAGEKSSNNAWLLSSISPSKFQKLSIFTKLRRDHGVLALPYGSYKIENERPGNLSINDNGTVRISKAPKLLDYTVQYSNVIDNNAQFTKADLHVPNQYQDIIKSIITEIDLENIPPAQAIVKLQAYFENNFKYSLFQKKQVSQKDPLQYFLETSKQGHCEYYASAGALILRAISIPTRYAAGYSMSEFDASIQRYVVRQRHAHAWTEAYINNKWVALDYTPSTWAEMEDQQTPSWQWMTDYFNEKTSDFQRWWEKDNDSFWTSVQIFFIVSLLIYFRKRFDFEGTRFNWRKKLNVKKEKMQQDIDSPFYQIINYLEKNIDQRHVDETIQSWLTRIEKQTTPLYSSLAPLVRQHYELVYGDRAFSEEKLTQFTKDVEHWLQEKNST